MSANENAAEGGACVYSNIKTTPDFFREEAKRLANRLALAHKRLDEYEAKVLEALKRKDYGAVKVNQELITTTWNVINGLVQLLGVAMERAK